MQTIWKYNLRLVEKQTKEMPDTAAILGVQAQNGLLTMWAVVDINEDHTYTPMTRTFYIFGTGNEIPVDIWGLAHIGTVQDGVFVWHVFEDEDAAVAG